VFAFETVELNAPVVSREAVTDDEQLAPLVGEAMRRQDWPAARRALHRMSPKTRASPDMLFLDAYLARRVGRLREAIGIYQRMLDSDASLIRVRLELADAFFDLADDRAADHNYRLALSGDVPDNVRDGVAARLRAIAERRRWRYNVSLAIAPDSNINAATDATQMQIFGLPFELSDEARRTSGVSFTAAAGGERSFALTDGVRLSFGAAGRFTDNERKAFDDGQLSLRAGPQVWIGEVRVETRASADQRWFGGEPLSTSTGVEVDAKWGFD
jgi:hypothetical protein